MNESIYPELVGRICAIVELRESGKITIATAYKEIADFRRIVKTAERRLDQLESMENGDSGIRFAGSGGDHSVRPESPVKEKGWPDCFRCDLWRPLSQECGGVNPQGKTPCEVMSRKAYKYLRRDD